MPRGIYIAPKNIIATTDFLNAGNTRGIPSGIITNLKSAAGKLEIKNKDDKKRVKVNKQILDSPEFKELWDRVKFKTTFSVDFDSNSLVKECINSIDEKLNIQRGKLHYTKSTITMSIGGVEVDDASVRTQTSNLDYEVNNLPDIVGYLQNETQLTRKSIVDILTNLDKLEYFKINLK